MPLLSDIYILLYILHYLIIHGDSIKWFEFRRLARKLQIFNYSLLPFTAKNNKNDSDQDRSFNERISTWNTINVLTSFDRESDIRQWMK